MRYIILLLTFLSPLTWANCTTQNVGQFAYTNCSDGTNYTTQTIGEHKYYSGDIQGTTQRSGNFQYHNLNGRSGTTQTIGDFQYHNIGNTRGSTQTIGDFKYHNWDDGTTGTTQRIGDYEYYND